MYKITENLEVGLNKVTPKALMVLKELGLYDVSVDNEEILKIILEIFIDKEKLDKLLRAIFLGIDKYDFEELDVTEIFAGYQGFLFKLVGNKS